MHNTSSLLCNSRSGVGNSCFEFYFCHFSMRLSAPLEHIVFIVIGVFHVDAAFNCIPRLLFVSSSSWEGLLNVSPLLLLGDSEVHSASIEFALMGRLNVFHSACVPIEVFEHAFSLTPFSVSEGSADLPRLQSRFQKVLIKALVGRVLVPFARIKMGVLILLNHI